MKALSSEALVRCAAFSLYIPAERSFALSNGRFNVKLARAQPYALEGAPFGFVNQIRFEIFPPEIPLNNFLYSSVFNQAYFSCVCHVFENKNETRVQTKKSTIGLVLLLNGDQGLPIITPLLSGQIIDINFTSFF